MGAFSVWHYLVLLLVLLMGFGVGMWTRRARAPGLARKLGIDRARPQRRRVEKPWARGRWRTTFVTLAAWAGLVTFYVWNGMDPNGHGYIKNETGALGTWLGCFLGGGALLAWVIWGWIYQDPRKVFFYNVPNPECLGHHEDDEDGWTLGPQGFGFYMGGLRVDYDADWPWSSHDVWD